MSANNESKDEASSAVKKNPCGMCRANGSAICKGHGGRGGGGGGGGSSSENQEEALTAASLTLDPKKLELLLVQNPALIKSDQFESTYEFANSNALFSMKLEMESGTIILRGKKDLSKEEQATLDEFYKTIEMELNAFKSELIEKGVKHGLDIKFAREGNDLTLKFPNPGHHDAFVKRLMDKNLFPAAPTPQPEKAKEARASVARDEVLQPNQSTAPTPFNIRNGLKPKGFE